MFPPSLQSVLASATHARHYETIITGDSVRVIANGRDDHTLALEMVEHLGRLNRLPVCASSTTDSSVGKSSSPPAPAASVPMPPEAIPMESIARTSCEPPPAVAPPAQTMFVNSMSTPASIIAPLLSKRAEIYQAGLQTKGAASSTKGEAKFVLDLLIELIGDKPVNEVDADDILKFQRAIAFWPVNIGRRKDFKEMKKLDVIKRGKAERLQCIDRTTQGRHMKTLITFFNACQRSRQLTANPCDSFNLKDFKDRIFRKKDRFSDDDLVTLFDPAKAKELTHPLLYWGPMIELYSPMRVNEVAQLFLEDVQRMEFMEKGVKRSIHFFNITDSGEGQHVKSGYSLRGMPIHSKLLDLGFLEYVEDVKKSGAKHLFPGLSWNDNRPGKTLSNWFNKNHLRKVCGIDDRRKTLHCFRHTTNTLADRALVPKGVMRSINGHSDGSDIGDRYYVTRATLSEAQDGLEKIVYPTLNLLPYAPGRFDEYLRHAVAQDKLFANLIKEGKPLPRRAGWSSKATSAMSSKPKSSKAKAPVTGSTQAATLGSGVGVLE